MASSSLRTPSYISTPHNARDEVPSGEGFENGVELVFVADAGASAHDAELDEDFEALALSGEECAKLFDLRG